MIKTGLFPPFFSLLCELSRIGRKGSLNSAGGFIWEMVKTPTTQPQPNLNLVGFDKIITLHIPHPTPPPQELYFYQ